MEVVIVPDPAAGAALVADAIAAVLRRKEDAVLGYATGGTPERVYAELVRRHRAGSLSFARARGFLLDEYVGVPEGHPARYRAVIERQVVDLLDIPSANVLGLDGNASDLPRACREYEQAIAEAGGVDLQLLGVGSDGHIGFNEPGSSLASRTRLKTLTERTRQDNARYFDGDVDSVPHHVLTQGIGTICEARHLVLAAWGPHKQRAIAAAVEGPITAMVPASAIQLHPHVTVIVDEPAAGSLQLSDYYRAVYEAKPQWQEL